MQVFIMLEHKAILIQNCMIKSTEALSDAEYGLKDGRKSLALNRLYYAVFYAVQALGYRKDFVTTKHTQLIGWFNKKFIHEEAIFPLRMYHIYNSAYKNRQEADYDLFASQEFTVEEIQVYLEDCKFFTGKVFTYLEQ